MKVVNCLSTDPVPNLGIPSADWPDWMVKAADLIRKMVCFDPASRLKVADVCENIEKLQGRCNPDRVFEL